MKITVRSVEELSQVAEALSQHVEAGFKIILLSGDLGTGKTTLTRELCAQWGVTEPVSSPTFSLVNAYDAPDLGIIYHMDLYRLDTPDDLAQIGFEEYLDSGDLCLIEWPELATPLIVQPYVLVKIESGDDQIRIFDITTHGTIDA